MKCQVCNDEIDGCDWRRRFCGRAECQAEAACRRSARVRERHRRDRVQREVSPAVACRVCGLVLEAISGGHLARHGMDAAAYKAQYPLAPLAMDHIRERRSAAGQKHAAWREVSVRMIDARFNEFLTGSLLGDGHIGPTKRSARYAEGGSNEQYLRWKHELLSAYVPASFKFRLPKPDKRTGKVYPGWWIRSKTHPVLLEQRRLWYPDGIKYIPRPFVEANLSLFALAVWFCDDGHSGDPTYLYTLDFQAIEVGFLSRLLADKFGLTANVRSLSGKPALSFPVKSADRLRDLLRPFSIPGMEYKWLINRAKSSRRGGPT